MTEGAGDLRSKALAIAGRLMREQGIVGEPRSDVPLGEDGLGFDSMARLDLLAAIESECAVSIPEKYWGTAPLRGIDELVRVARRK